MRLHDPEFRLAIVGDFSCGKSTFPNAFIGEELLTTDNLQTTAIPTEILRKVKNRATERIETKIYVKHGGIT